MDLVEVNLKDLKNFLAFINDKVDSVYKEETDRAIKEFLRELGGENHDSY